MAQSIFAANATQFIDAIDTGFAPSGIWNLGVEFLGPSKAFVRRCLAGFDVLGAAASGRALRAGDAITAAELVLQTTLVVGPTGWAARVERISRADWDYTTANWNRYRVGSNWTAGGGDVATPPAHVAVSSPSVAGEQVIAGMAEFVTDAIANRGGVVLVRVKADAEAPAQSQWCSYDASLASSARPRLRVTYSAAEPSPIDNPHASAMIGEQPEGPTSPDQGAAAERPETLSAPSGLRSSRRRRFAT